MWKSLNAFTVVFAIAGAINYEQFREKYCFEEEKHFKSDHAKFICENFTLTKKDLDEMARIDYEISNSTFVILRNCKMDYFNENIISLFPDAVWFTLRNCILSLDRSWIGNSTKRNIVLKLTFDKCDIRGNLNRLAFSNLEDLKTVSIKRSTLQYSYVNEHFLKRNGLEFSLSIENTKVNFQRGLFSKIPYLSSMTCDSCQLKEIDSLFDSNSKTSLREMSFAGNKLTSFPRSLSSQEQIETIDLSGNRLIEIVLTRAHFKSMRNLKILHLSENKNITAIGYLAFNDTNLKDLILSNVSLTTLDKLGCTKVLRIDFSYNKISEIGPQVFEDLANLIYLKLSYNQISKLDETVFKCLIKLEDLYLNSNKLEELPKDIFGNLQKLGKLNLNGNLLKKIKDGLFPNALFFLDVSNNPFTLMLKSYFTNLADLEFLDISNTTDSTKYFDNQILRSLDKLDVLKMSYNHVTNIDDIFLPATLSFIDLGTNEITHISNTVLERLSYLEYINLTDNPIQQMELDLMMIKFPRIQFEGANVFIEYDAN